jgi:hypothetical protein
MNDQTFLSRLNVIEKINNKIFLGSLSKENKETQNNIVFIYTPPKVGSTCLVTSIRLSASLKFCVLHVHDEVMLNYIVDGIVDVTVNEIIKYNNYLGKNVYVIDVYRTPMERKFSEFFEKISVYHFNNTEEKINKYKIDRIVKRFNNIFPYLSQGDHYADKFGLTITPFVDGQLYDTQTVDGIRYIKLRLKDSNKWGIILSQLLETEITIVKDYETEGKTIGEMYKTFKTTYKIPTNYFESIEKDKYLSLYYSTTERDEYLDSWRSKIFDESFNSFYNESEYNFYVNLYMENQSLSDLQLEHYIDCGCLCVHCSLRRKELINKTKQGIKLNQKIIHNEIMKEVQVFKKLLSNKIKQRNQEVQSVLNMSKSNKIKKNTMSNVIGSKY